MPYNIGIDARKLTDFGIGTYIQNLIFSLSHEDPDNEYVLFVGSKHADAFSDLPSNFRTVVERSPVYSVRELLALSWRLFRLRLDLYHSTHYVLPALVPCKAVVTIHDIIHLLYPEFLPSSVAFFYAQRMIRRSLTRGDRIIADSQNTKTDLMDYFDIDGRKIRLIYPGVADQFRQPVDDSAIDDWLQRLELKRPYILFVGNPKPHKNLDNVVKSFARALEISSFDGDLVCVGDRGGMEVKVRKRAEQLGVSERVKLPGYVDDDALPALYQGASLFLYPTLYEGFGLPVVEAMASGVPVITSNTSALKEVAEGYGHLVNPLDVEETAKAIARCMNDQEHRETLTRTGRRRARDFNWSRTAKQTLEVYMSALEPGRTSGPDSPRAQSTGSDSKTEPTET